MTLETERLILRPWRVTDAESLFEYAKDPEVGPAAGWPPHKSLDESLNVILNVLNGKECYAICEKGSDKAIGSIELLLKGHSTMTNSDDECELGYWLGKPFWGRGYMPEAAREMIRHGFVECRMNTIWCGFYEGNKKSERVQEKLGLSYHHTCASVPVPLMHETRICHTNFITRDDWKRRFDVRKLSEEEYPEALKLAWQVFSDYEAPVYSTEGVEEFKKTLENEEYLKGISYIGAFNNGKLVGLLGFRPATRHICFFFIDGKYQRLGLGTRLFRRMKTVIKGKTITVNSSPFGFPFYQTLGFKPLGGEETVNGIRFTPMALKGRASDYSIIKLKDRQDLKDRAAEWFHDKWGVPKEAYLESIEASFNSVVPSWYLCFDGDDIIGGIGVIENDFHDRKDLTPNVCAVYTEKWYRKQGIAGMLLNHVCADMAANGIDTLYLLTGHTGFYERYGWEYLCMAQGEGDDEPSRMYVHKISGENQ